MYGLMMLIPSRVLLMIIPLDVDHDLNMRRLSVGWTPFVSLGKQIFVVLCQGELLQLREFLESESKGEMHRDLIDLLS